MESHPQCQDGSGGLSGTLKGFGRDGRGWEAHLEGQEVSGGPPGGLGGVGRHSGRSSRGREFP